MAGEDYTKYVIYKGTFPNYDSSGNGYLDKSGVGTIDSLDCKYQIQVDKMATPMATSANGIAFDLRGVTKEITLECHRIDTPANLATFLNYFKGIETETSPTGLISSRQILDAVKFHNPFFNSTNATNDITIVITNFTYTYEGGTVERVKYTLTFMETRSFA